MDLGSRESPEDELGVVASNEMWGDTYDRVAAHHPRECTTLVFVNTRRLSERVTHHLAEERLGENAVLPHHGTSPARCASKPNGASRAASCAP